MTFLILKVTLLQSLKFFLGFFSFFFNSELNIFQILKSIGHENGKRNIEIQGHVNGDGSQSFSSKRLSKKRAKGIVQHLVAAGISPKRLSAKGFGFTNPVYAFPETEMQKEANRRVEILIK